MHARTSACGSACTLVAKEAKKRTVARVDCNIIVKILISLENALRLGFGDFMGCGQDILLFYRRRSVSK